MLKTPYTRYNRLYVYHLDLAELPQLDDPDLIAAWLEDNSALFFFHRPKEKLILQLCQQTGSSIIYAADLDYSDWEAGREFVRFNVEDICVAPIWDTDPARIRLDPSVVFGSGFHPSTRLCMQLLWKLLGNQENKIRTALDLGTGTGLLAITAATLGVEKIIAIDHNSFACTLAKSNIELNQQAKQITVTQVDLQSKMPDTGVDLVIANLYKGLLEQIIHQKDFWHASYYIFSGFIPEMEPDLLAALPANKNIRILERQRNNLWCAWMLLNLDK